MVYLELTGAFLIALGVYALARPLSIRSFPSANQWEAAPERAKREQRAYASMAAFFLVLGGLALVVVGVTGWTPGG